MSRIILFLSFFFLSSSFIYCQNTVGLLSYNEDQSYDGYNLIYPHNQGSVYLINNCGEIVHVWPDEEFVPGNVAYITEQGNLVKCKRLPTSAVNDPIWAGGGGEFVEIVSWENESLAIYELNDSLMRLHHDIAVMPNGHILMIAWELKTLDESVRAGRDTTKLSQDKLWPEAILEWDPDLDSIVWKWHVWDHLIQDYDPEQENFGVVSDHPELIDINYDEHDGHPDWLHINAIDYNPVLDQIALSVPYFNEIWIIDHSTSTEEAAGHEGGRSKMGGDIIYRWGNPKTYNPSDSLQQLFFQHDVHWVNPLAQPGDTEFGKIALFNNRIDDHTSQASVLTTPWDDQNGIYSIIGDIYGPDQFERVAQHPDDSRSISSSLSSAQILPNDNILICAGRWGFSYEMTPTGEVVWEYITPIKRGDRTIQGDTSLTINANLTFRIKRYSKDFAGFSGKDLEPSGYIELEPDTSFCAELTTFIQTPGLLKFNLYPNPTADYLFLDSDLGEELNFSILDINGQEILKTNFSTLSKGLDLSTLPSGVYYLYNPKGFISPFSKL